MSTQMKYDKNLVEPDTMTDRTILLMVRTGMVSLHRSGNALRDANKLTDGSGNQHPSHSPSSQHTLRGDSSFVDSSRPDRHNDRGRRGNGINAEASTIELTDYSYRSNNTAEDGNHRARTAQMAYSDLDYVPGPQPQAQPQAQAQPKAQPSNPTLMRAAPSWRAIFAVWSCLILLTLGWGFLNFDKFKSYIIAPLGEVETQAAVGDVTENEVVDVTNNEPAEQLIIAKAFVLPSREAELGLASTGLVNNVYIQEGETVTAGQVLLTLDNSQQSVAVARAKANLSRTQARLDEVKAGSRSEELLAQQAVVEAAKARLASLLSRNIAADEQAAMARIRAAEAGLASLLSRNIVADEQAAMARIRAAEAELSKLYETPENAQVVAGRAELKNAEAARSRAQRAYDAVKWRNDIGRLPESQDLQQATNDYEAAQARIDLLYQGPTSSQINQAQANIAQAQAELEQVRKPANAGDIEAAKANIAQAQAELEQVRKPANAGDVDAAKAEIAQAEANLRLLQAGNRSEVIKFAEAEVAAAQAELLNAEVALSQTQLRAPFDGTVVTLNAELGEFLQVGQFVARIGDLARWQLVTDDLIELDVINVTDDASVKIYIDSLPDLELTGKVVRTQRFGENRVGDITYRVFIEPNTYVPELAWNMTASVHIVQGTSSPN